MVSIALVDARKTSLTGVQNSQKKSARRYAARGRWSPLRYARKTSLTGVQNSKKKIGSPLRGSWTMVSIALVDAGKHHLRGFKIAQKNRLAASRLVDDGLHCVMPGKHHLREFKIAKKNRLAASRLVDDGLHCVSRCQENITYGGSK